MRNSYQRSIRGLFLLIIAATVLPVQGDAQTTINTTVGSTGYTATNGVTGNSMVTFVIENTSGSNKLLTQVGNNFQTASNGATVTLWYTSTSLSGTPNVVTPTWTSIQSNTINVTANGIIDCFTGLSFVIPNGAQYRFALQSSSSIRYSGSAAGNCDPDMFTAGGVNLKVGEAQVAGANVGYGGAFPTVTNNPRWFTGTITFMDAAPCTSPPIPGTSTISPSTPVCTGTSMTLSLTGNSGGTGQTYQWESSANIGGPWAPFSGVLNSATYTFSSPSTSTYYRNAVTCGGNTQYSTPVQLVASAGLAGGTYSINSNLATGGTNYHSFADAVNALSCGITGPIIFNVDATSGPYNEQVIIPQVGGASAINTVTFNGSGRTLQFASTNTNERAGIKLNGADHIIINDLNIVAAGTTTTQYGFGVQLINDADSNVVNNCTISINTSSTSTNYAGIVISSSATSATTTGSALCDFNVFSNNTITGGYYSITNVGSSTVANFGNKIKGNTIKDFYSYGIYISGTGATLIDSNNISRPTRTTLTTHYGIYFTGLSVTANVTRNRIHAPFGGDPSSTSIFYGIYFTGVDALSGLENVVSNNLVYDIEGGSDQYGLYNSSSDNVHYYHNTIALGGTLGAGTTSDFTRGFYQITAAAGIDFRNNIITITRNGPSQKTAIYFGTTIAASNVITSNRNDLYVSSSSGTVNTGFFNGAAQATLIDWQTASAQDANSVATNPVYADVALGNYQPTNASIDNRGTPAGITIDINGNARSATTPDIGAYEFVPAICTTPPTAGNATVSETPVCVNSPVQLGLTGNSVGLGQTYQWQRSTAIGGPYTSVGNILTNPDTAIVASSTFYWRAAVTCSGNTVFSAPIFLSVNPALPSGTYTIDQTGASSPDFLTFNDAKAALACGIDGPVVFNVVSGTGPYIEQLILDSIPGTSAVNTVTFNGNGETIIDTSTNTNERAVIKLNGSDYVGFYNLVITAGGTSTTEYGFGVQIINDADNNTINNCTININTSSTSTNFAGVVINSSGTSSTATGDSRCDNNTISFNTINGGYVGISVVANGSTNKINNNKLFNNTIKDFYTYGIYVNGTTNILAEGNNISRPVRNATGTTYGIYFTGISTGAKISKNRLHNMFDGIATSTSDFYGIYLTGADAPVGAENIVSNNAIYNINHNGLVYAIYNVGSDNAWYYHNTISLDNAASTATGVTRGFYQTTAADGIRLRNNIITISRGGTGTKHAVYFATSTSTYTSNYNNFYIDAGTANAFVGYNGTNQATLANWQTATTQDANSMSVDPVYSNMAAGNLLPNFGPLDNKGTPVSITTDILSQPRSVVTPDIGAWEFAVQPCTSPPTPGVSNAVPNTGICLGTQIQLSLTGNSSGLGQSFQWEFSTSATGPWTPLGTSMLIPDTVINASATLYYRTAVTCSGNTAYSTPVLVNMNPPFPAGTYTINNAAATDYPGGTNFHSFGEAVAVMECGISGPVIFNVVAGVYTGQVRMHAITGSSPVNTVTFKSQDGNAASVILTSNITTGPNYVLQLDSSSNVIYKNMTITATGATNARAVEITSIASNDSLLNLVINVPVSTSTSNAMAGIVGTAMTGNDIVIKGNTINNGSSGIYMVGSAAATPANRLLIDSNTVNGSYYYNIYTSNAKRILVRKNSISISGSRNATTYGIYSTNSDTAYQYVGNTINIDNATNTTTYGLYLTSADASPNDPGRVANNKISALVGNTGTIYGMYQTATTFNNTVNNVIVMNTSGASSYGIYSTGGGLNRYYNNSVNSVASSATNNYAAYFANTSGSGVDVRNNIFSHMAGGRAMYVGSTSYVYSNYNMLYTTGTVLVQSGTPAGSFATLDAWRNASSSDPNSIVYSPAFSSATNLTPDINNPDVWAIHGRGEQIVGNNYDFNNNSRPTTVVAGVPDLGAYEFLPVIAPPVLPATPATPAAGTTQVFMFGTDTVSKISWKPASPIPSSVSVRRYSGVTPPGMSAGAKYMYFYTDVDVTGTAVPNYELKQFYIDPWQGLIPRETVTRLGRTISSGAWIMDPVSTVDTIANILTRDTLHFMDKFTGMTDSTVAPPPPPPYIVSVDSSNRGTRFWVAYGHHYGFSANSQDMVLYLSAEEPATVQVKVNGTSWVRTYNIPANTVRVSDVLPKSGLVDARLLDEGFSDKGISITSDVPIVAYAHIYDGANSGAGMLLPVGVYGYEYRSLNSKQYYPTGGAGSYSWFYVIADRDSTKVEITPTVLTKGGRPANVPFTVMLNRGEVYNVMGTQSSGGDGTDLSGSAIRSVPNESGKCYPIAVFSGSSRTALCNTTNGDNVIQQVFPNQAWGKRYLSFGTANSASNTTYNSNLWRVMVKDPATIVKRNGVVMTGLVTPGNYYEFGITTGNGASTASYIEADQPVMVAQYMLSTDGTGCSGLAAPTGNGDPEQIFISPLEQGIKKAVFYNTTESAITSNYINVVIPTGGLASLTIDGSNTFTDMFDHPYLPGYKCIRQNLGGAAGQHIIQSDSAFNAITYGLGSVESYGYNAGTLVKNLRASGSISNVLASSTVSYTCKGTPFRFSIKLSVKPTNLVWHFSQVPGLSPAVDLSQASPVPSDSSFNNGQWYYVFNVTQDYTINGTGTFALPISVTHPSLEGCSNSLDFTLPITVIPAPVVDFSYIFPGCVNGTAQFNGTGTSSNGMPINTWNWNFGDGSTATGTTTPTHQWTTPGNYLVSLRGITADGCVDDTTKTIGVSLPLTVSIVPDSIPSCNGSSVSISVQNPVAGATYNWYTDATAGTLVHTGSTYTFTVTGPVSYYVEGASASGCISLTRKKVSVYILPNITTPSVVADSIGAHAIRFSWNAVPNATGYQVSLDNGATWITPSSGATGLTHTVAGLQIGQAVTLTVRALGGCVPGVSQPVTALTINDAVFIPNSFTPNGDGLNDVLKVYGNFIKTMKISIFNQWGEKIFESQSQLSAWDGTHKGKPQPSGVYMYVCDVILNDGTKLQRKGAINLIR